MLVIVAAIGKQGQLGLDKVMPWHNPEDLKHFKNLTMYQKIVIGRVTYENLPSELKGRHVHLVTRDENYKTDKPLIHDFKAFCQKHEQSDDVYYICGGQHIYEQALPYTNEFYLSMIDYTGPADTYFPEFSMKEFDVEIIPYETFDLYHCVRKKSQ